MKRFLHIIPILLLILAAYACAKIGSPYGGPKDETPPTLVSAKPPENTVNFEPKKKIVLQFDEYVQLKDILQELIISPPLEDRISATIKGKSVLIEFPDEAVFDSTTYTISFGNAISDFNEGNVLENYQYVFSLKDYIDTMNVEGTLVSAFDLKPDEDRMLVMLYSKLEDSIPLLEKPNYIARTDKTGKFSINRIETGNYRIFALKDGNLNNLYDLPNENIAFGDSIIELTPEKFRQDMIIQDSALADSLASQLHAADEPVSDSILSVPETGDSPAGDTTAVDSVAAPVHYIFRTELFFFAKDVYNQYLTDYERPRRELLSFTFNEEPLDSVDLYTVSQFPAQDEWYLLDASPKQDSLKFWITDSTLYRRDSLKVELYYPLLDSLGSTYFMSDTLQMNFREIEKTPSRGSKDTDAAEKESQVSLTVRNNITKSNAFDLNRKIILSSETPLADFIADSMSLFRKQDTLEFPVPIKCYRDTTSLYDIVVDFKPEEKTTYRFFAPDQVIRDIYGTLNDTLDIHFQTQSVDAYSTLLVTVNGVREPVILQLMSPKEEVRNERYLDQNGTERFEYLPPGKYMLKLIIDRNGNRKWDTGDYLLKVQPEKVLFFDQPVDLRANWEIEYVWDLKY
ncbi:MAG: Ig-like domain-containing protein [Bacteroidales bacterium]|nr:Ig-like domain-containing protein [Bacteroidales bacterium]